MRPFTVRSLKHNQLSTFGLLKEHPKLVVRDWVFQLVGLGVLVQEGTEYPVLKLNDASWQVMRKEREVTLGDLGLITCSPFPRQQAVAFRLCALALGDVGKHPERPDDLALWIRYWAGASEGQDHRAIAMLKGKLRLL